MRIQLIRSATLRIKSAGHTILVDPWLAGQGQGHSYAGGHRSPLVQLPIPIEDVVAGIDAVLVSHLHSDHFDEAALTALDPTLPVFAPLRIVDALRAKGLADVRPIAGCFDFGPLRGIETGGEHGPPAILDEMGPVSGFVLRAPGEPVLYWVGDSILCDEVRAVIAVERPDVIVVHGCGAIWGGAGPLVMDAAMVLETLRISGAAVVVVTHMDAVDHATVTREALRAAARLEPTAEGRLLIPQDGATVEFASAPGR